MLCRCQSRSGWASVVQHGLGKGICRVEAHGASAEGVEVDGVGGGAGSEAAFEAGGRRILEEGGEGEQLGFVAGVEGGDCIRCVGGGEVGSEGTVFRHGADFGSDVGVVDGYVRKGHEDGAVGHG